jgi:hypothetical protein
MSAIVLNLFRRKNDGRQNNRWAEDCHKPSIVLYRFPTSMLLEKDFRVKTVGLDFLVLIPLFSVSVFRSLIVVFCCCFAHAALYIKDRRSASGVENQASSPLSTS